MIFFISFTIFLILLLMLAFFMLSKSEKWESSLYSTFECGFTSYFFSRFSFSIHYYLIGLIFLFLDLEICFLLPFFNEEFSSYFKIALMLSFLFILLMGLLEEWKEGKIEWNY